MNKGLLENSTISNPEYILKGDNLSVSNGSYSVRKGITIHGKCSDVSEGKSIEQKIPYLIKKVSISGEELVLMVTASGNLVGILPCRINKYYNIHRRIFEIDEQIELFNNNTIFSSIDIYEIGNFIYIISNCRSWVIKKDGILSFADDKITVDAQEATIYDLDTVSLYIKGIGKFASNIIEDTSIYSRFRSEFGGRGRPTFPVKTKTMQTYVCEVGDSLTGKMYSGSGPEEIAYKPIVYATNVKNQIKNDSSDTTKEKDYVGNSRQIVLHKNIKSYGVLCYYKETSKDILTIGIYGARGIDDDSLFPLGKRVGLTLSMGTYAAGQKTWIDGTVVTTPADFIPSDKTCVFVEVEKTNPVFGFVPDGVSGPEYTAGILFKELKYDKEDVVVGTEGETPITLTLNLASIYNTIDGHAYMTIATSIDETDGIEDIQIYEALSNIFDGTTSICTVLPELNRVRCSIPAMIMKNSETGVNPHYGIYGWTNYECSAAEYGIDSGGVRTLPTLNFFGDDAGILTGKIMSMNMKTSMKYSSSLDGVPISMYNIIPLNITWFKDRAFSPSFYIIEYYDTNGGEPTIHNSLAPLVVISDVHEIEHTNNEQGTLCDFILTPPSELSGGYFPVKTNVWNDCNYNSTENKNKIYYNPSAWVNKEGEVIIQTDTSIDDADTDNYKIFDKSLLCLYKQISFIDKDVFNNGYYEVYAQIGGNIPVKIGEEYSLFRTILDLEYDTQKRLTQYGLGIATYTKYGFRHTPILLSNISMFNEPEINKYCQSVGAFTSTCYFNGKFYFASSNTIKETNMLLEYDPLNTFIVTGLIKGMIALTNQMYIFTEEGIYTFSQNKEISKFSNAIVNNYCVVGERLYFSDISGTIYHTEFTPVPVAQQYSVTNNPYIIKVEDTSSISEVTKEWIIYTMASADNKLYVSTNKGTYVLDTTNNVWLLHKYPYTPLLMTEYNNKIFAVGGDYVDGLYELEIPYKNIPLYEGGPS